MNTDPINIETQAIPSDSVLIKGLRLTNTARPAGIPFRVANITGIKSRQLSAGIIILKADLPRWEEAVKRTAQRREKEKKVR